jgi:general secretion pathway protein C
LSAIEQLKERVLSDRRTPLAVNLIAVILLAYSASQWTLRMWKPAQSLRAPGVAPALIRPVSLDLPTIVGANLFGSPDAGAGAALSPELIPLTTLNVVLTGVMVYGNDSFAFLSINGGPEEPVAIGQEVTGGATLYSVLPDRAILQRGGGFEAAVLRDSDSKLPAGAVMSGAGPTVVRPEALRSPQVLSQAHIVPNSGGGFLVRTIQAGSIYEKLGLRAGDVIRSINGQTVNNMEDVLRIYRETGANLNQPMQVTLDVMRAGKPEQLQFQMN